MRLPIILLVLVIIALIFTNIAKVEKMSSGKKKKKNKEVSAMRMEVCVDGQKTIILANVIEHRIDSRGVLFILQYNGHSRPRGNPTATTSNNTFSGRDIFDEGRIIRIFKKWDNIHIKGAPRYAAHDFSGDEFKGGEK